MDTWKHPNPEADMSAGRNSHSRDSNRKNQQRNARIRKAERRMMLRQKRKAARLAKLQESQ